jgi:hypothetical protein
MNKSLAPHTTPVTVNFGDGIERPLKYTVGATKRLDQQYGGLDKMMKLPTWDFIAVIHSGLVDKNISVEEIADLIDNRDLPYLMGRFFEAFTGKTPEQMASDAKDAAKNAESSPVE